MSDVGRNIRKYRLGLDMSQAELARRIGRRRSAIGNYETGAREPDYDTLRALAQALGVTETALLSGDAPADDGDELWSLREELRRDPNRRMLLSLAKNGTAQEVRQAAALIDALKRTNPELRD